jgi:hypothetical protein
MDTGSGVGTAGVSVGEGIGSGVDVGEAAGVSVSAGGRIVAVGIDSVTEPGEGEIWSSIHGGEGTSVAVVPHPVMAAVITSNMKTMMIRPIYFPARRVGLRAVRV